MAHLLRKPPSGHGLQHYAPVQAILPLGKDSILTASRDAAIAKWAASASPHGIVFDAQKNKRAHTDWVLDLIHVDSNMEIVASAGADRIVCIWDLAELEVKSTLRQHQDSVEALAFSKDHRKLVSAGLGDQIWIWDLENNEHKMRARTRARSHLAVHPSYYSLDAQEHIFAAGSTDGCIRLWDLRAAEEEYAKIGNAIEGSTIRSLKVSPCGQFVLSGGSEDNNELKMWDLRKVGSGKQFPVWSKSVLPGSSSIWSIDCSKTFEKAVVGGNSNVVSIVDLLSHDVKTLVSLDDKDTILQVRFDHEQKESEQVSSVYICSAKGGVIYVPSSTGIPNTLIQNGVGIKRAKTLPDNLCIACENTKNEISIFNALTGHLDSYLGTSKTWDQLFSDYKPDFVVNRWFTVDTHLGCLALYLESPSCFNASLYLSSKLDVPRLLKSSVTLPENQDFDISNLGEFKLNFGEMILSRLFKPRFASQTSEINKDLETYDPEFDIFVRTRDEETVSLNSISREDLEFKLPQWLTDAVLSKTYKGSECKIRFELVPAPDSNLPRLSKGERFTSADMVSVRRLCMFVINSLRVPQHTALTAFQKCAARNSFPPDSPLPEQIVSLSCKGSKLLSSYSLKTIRDLYSPSHPLSLEYRLL